MALATTSRALAGAFADTARSIPCRNTTSQKGSHNVKWFAMTSAMLTFGIALAGGTFTSIVCHSKSSQNSLIHTLKLKNFQRIEVCVVVAKINITHLRH